MKKIEPEKENRVFENGSMNIRKHYPVQNAAKPIPLV